MEEINGDFDGRVEQMWVVSRGTIGNRAGTIDEGIATVRALDGEIVGFSEGEGDMLVEQCCKVGTPKPNKKFGTYFERKPTMGQKQM